MAKKVLIRLMDEVSALVHGLSDEHLQYFYEKYGVYAPNYFFNPKYKLGRWDGKIRYFKESGKTYVYLIEDILPRIARLGYKIELEDERTTNVITPDPVKEDVFAHIEHLDTGQPIILRDYQVNAVNQLIEHGNGIILSSTGSGKTFMCAALAKAYGDRGIKTLTIVPNKDLINQTKRDYVNCELDTGEYSGITKTLNHQHVVSTWQALQNNTAVIPQFNMVIVDECHGLKGNVLSSILTEHAASMPYRFGFTGTMPKEPADCLAVNVAVGMVRASVGAAQLIERGVLAKPHINILQLEEDVTRQYVEYVKECVDKPFTYTQFKDRYFPDFSAEKAYLRKNTTRLQWIAHLIEEQRDSKKGNVLCLVDSIPSGRKLASMVDGAIFVNGQDVKNPKDRQQVYDMFKDKDDLVVIATVNIAGTGLSINRIFNLMLIDVGKSFIRVIQAIGRGLRMAEDKNSVVITDVCSDFKYAKRHLTMRVGYYKEAQYPYKKVKVKYTEDDL